MNFAKLLKTVLLASAVIGSVQAFDKKVVIKLHGQKFTGQTTLKLKQLARSQYPGLRLQKFNIERVKFIAKSKHGGGKARLKVGSAQSMRKRVNGHPSDFHVNAGYTYDRLNFINPKSNSNGVWQMKIQGKIKVKRIVLFLERKYSAPTSYAKTCTATLETLWGSDIRKFTSQGVGPTPQIAKSKACQKALYRCSQANGDNPILMCTL